MTVTAGDVAGMLAVLFAGLLAGEEFVIRNGVRGPLATLDDKTHILLRQALIRNLRVLVPSMYAVALVSAVVAALLDGIDSGIAIRAAGILALVIWIAVTAGGTVPINSAVLEWNASAPPASWRTQVDRWERLNTVRTMAAVIGFILLLVSLTLTATKH